uniref:Uncharacterized protein n=1 Tax=Leersia perrieri TaxID=77586 RepID=A0A0D9W504_9ORYZ
MAWTSDAAAPFLSSLVGFGEEIDGWQGEGNLGQRVGSGDGAGVLTAVCRCPHYGSSFSSVCGAPPLHCGELYR